MGVIRDIGPQLVGRDDRNELIFLHDVAFVDGQLTDQPGDLRADDHLVGCDDTGERERRRAAVQIDVRPGAEQHEDQEEQPHPSPLHIEQTYKTFV